MGQQLQQEARTPPGFDSSSAAAAESLQAPAAPPAADPVAPVLQLATMHITGQQLQQEAPTASSPQPPAAATQPGNSVAAAATQPGAAAAAAATQPAAAAAAAGGAPAAAQVGGCSMYAAAAPAGPPSAARVTDALAQVAMFGMSAPRNTSLELDESIIPSVTKPRSANSFTIKAAAAAAPAPAGSAGRHVVDPTSVIGHAQGLAVEQCLNCHQAAKGHSHTLASRHTKVLLAQATAKAAAERLAEAKATAAADRLAEAKAKAAADLRALLQPRAYWAGQLPAKEPEDSLEEEYHQSYQAFAAGSQAAGLPALPQQQPEQQQPLLQQLPLPLPLPQPQLQQQPQQQQLLQQTQSQPEMQHEVQEAQHAADKAAAKLARARAAADDAIGPAVAAALAARAARHTAEDSLRIRVCTRHEFKLLDGLQLSQRLELGAGEGAHAQIYAGFMEHSPVAVKKYNMKFRGPQQEPVETIFMREVQLQVGDMFCICCAGL